MDKTKVTSELFCLHCNENTIHEITYLGENIRRIVCTQCRKEYHTNDESIREEYAKDIIHRLITKPRRMSEEMKKDLVKSMSTLPKRIITKSYRMVKDYKQFKKDAKQ